MIWKKFKNTLLINYSSIIIIAISISALVVYYVISITSNGVQKNKVTEIYFADNISSAHQSVIDRFNKKFEGKIKVIPIDLPFLKFSTNERKELLTRALRSKSERIDVFAVDLIWVPRFAKWCQPLDEFFPDVKSDGFLAYAMESCIVDDYLAAVPFYIDVSMMYYRIDLLKKIPNYKKLIPKLESSITWEEFLSLSKYFDSNKNPFYLFPADDYEGLICSYFELILSQDPDFFKKGEYNLNEGAPRKSLELLVDLVNKYKVSPKIITSFDENDAYHYFLENDGVFLRGWPGFQKDNKNFSHDLSKEKLIKKAALPHFKSSSSGSVFGGWNLMVSKFSANKKEVVEFIKFVVSEEAQEILFNEGSFLPVRSKFYQNQKYLSEFPEIVYLKKLLDKGIHRPFLKDYTRVSDIISYYVKRAIKNEVTIDMALMEAEKMIKTNKVIIK